MRQRFVPFLALSLTLLLARPCRAHGPILDTTLWQSEAEAGQLSDAMTIYQDPEASGGLYVASPTNLNGAVSYTVSVRATGYYYLWARAKGASWVGDSFSVVIDEGTPFHWTIPQVGGRWDWGWSIVNETAHAGQSLQLTAGERSLTFRCREADAALDQLVLSDSAQSPEERPTVPNDLIENASLISSLPYTWTQHIAAATGSPSDPSLQDPYVGGKLNPGRSVWLRYSAATDGILSVDALDTGFDVVMAIYEGSPGSLSEMDLGMHIGGRGSAIVSTPVVAGRDYFIMIDGSPTPSDDTITLRLEQVTPQAMPWDGIDSTARDHWFLHDASADCETLSWLAMLKHALGESISMSCRVYDVYSQSFIVREWLADESFGPFIETQSGHPLLLGCKLGPSSGWDQWRITADVSTTALQADDFSGWSRPFVLGWDNSSDYGPRWQRHDPLGGATFESFDLDYIPYLAVTLPDGPRALADGTACTALQASCEMPLRAQAEISVGDQPGDRAGLLIQADADNLVSVGLAEDGTLRLERCLEGVWTSSAALGPAPTSSATLGLWCEGDIVGASLTPYAALQPTLSETVYWPQSVVSSGAEALRMGLFVESGPQESTTLLSGFEPQANMSAADPFAAPLPVIYPNLSLTGSTAGLGVSARLIDFGGCPDALAGPERVYVFDAPLSAVYGAELVPQGADAADLRLMILDASRLPSRCLAWGKGVVPFTGTAKSRYYLIVDGPAGEAGPYKLTLHGDAYLSFIPCVTS